MDEIFLRPRLVPHLKGIFYKPNGAQLTFNGRGTGWDITYVEKVIEVEIFMY